MISLDLYYYINMSHMSLTVLHFVEKLGLCTFIKWNLLTLQMAKWRFYQSSRPNQLRSCQSTAGTATWGCRGFTYQRKLPSLAGCFLSPRATASTVDSTMSPCKIHKALHHSAIYLSHSLFILCSTGFSAQSCANTSCFSKRMFSLSFEAIFDGVPLQL